MRQIINVESIISSVIAGYIIFLITKNHSKSARTKSGIELDIKIKFKSRK